MSIATQLRKGYRDINMPNILELANGERLICQQVLRFLPGKRIILRAQWQERLVLIKLLLNTRSGERNLRRELTGYQILQNAQITTPELLLTTQCKEGHHILIFEFLQQALTLSQLWQEQANRQEIATSMLRLIVLMHAKGCNHKDIHFDNFLQIKEQIYVLDMSAVSKESTTEYGVWQRENLALWITNFTPLYQQILLNLLKEYYTQAANDSLLKRSIKQSWRRRKTHYLKKCLRESTEFSTSTDWHHVATWKRTYDCADLDSFLRSPDAWIKKGTLLKDGYSTTVARVKMGKQWVVIKRHNIRNIFRFARYCWRPTRSRNSWHNAHLLKLNGIDTPEPIAFLEKRWGMFNLGGYYLCAFNNAPSAQQKYISDLPTQQELEWVADLFHKMQLAPLYHRDLKASNLLVSTHGIMLIDIDSMKECSSDKKATICLRKDRNRFLKNWQGKPKQQRAFATVLNKI